MDMPKQGTRVHVYQRACHPVTRALGPLTGPRAALVDNTISNRPDVAWAMNRGVSVRFEDTKRVTLAVFSEDALPEHSTTWRWP